MRGKALKGDFSAADELTSLAQADKLASFGPVMVERAGEIGPLIELVIAKRAHPDQFANVVFKSPFVRAIENALDHGVISGTAPGSITGIFPLSKLYARTESGEEMWLHWRSRVEQAANASGFSRSFAAAMAGALGELQDNVLEHSDAPDTGLLAFAATRSSLELVVSDSGIGVLASLKQNPEHSNLTDSGTALKVAITDGKSRHSSSSGHGFGIGSLFRALVNHDAQLRFRSGDYALTISGHSPSLQGQVKLACISNLNGLTITARCPTRHSHC